MSRHTLNTSMNKGPFRKYLIRLGLGLVLAPGVLSAYAEEPTVPANETLTPYEACMLGLTGSASNAVSLGQVRTVCTRQVQSLDNGQARSDPLSRRQQMERLSLNSPFGLLPHNRNYLLPLTYSQFLEESGQEGASPLLDHIEVQFQLSLKVILIDGLYRDAGSLSFAYTARSYWRAYNLELSSPFRETNHEPEFILSFENDYKLWGFENVDNGLSLNHQSNGRGGEASRSWNRLIFRTMWQKGRFATELRTWYRLPEPEKRFPEDPLGDDNPDIGRYMGNFEWDLNYTGNSGHYSMMLRNNLMPDNRGAVRLRWSFPINARVSGLVQYFEGYGESLIDYNEYNRSLGIGFELGSWF